MQLLRPILTALVLAATSCMSQPEIPSLQVAWRVPESMGTEPFLLRIPLAPLDHQQPDLDRNQVGAFVDGRTPAPSQLVDHDNDGTADELRVLVEPTALPETANPKRRIVTIYGPRRADDAPALFTAGGSPTVTLTWPWDFAYR